MYLLHVHGLCMGTCACGYQWLMLGALYGYSVPSVFWHCLSLDPRACVLCRCHLYLLNAATKAVPPVCGYCLSILQFSHCTAGAWAVSVTLHCSSTLGYVLRGWRDGSLVKNVHLLLQRIWIQFPTPTTIYTSNFRGAEIPFWPSWAPGIHTCTDIHGTFNLIAGWVCKEIRAVLNVWAVRSLWLLNHPFTEFAQDF